MQVVQRTRKNASRYIPIWLALKAGGDCTVAVAAKYHSKVIKMVKNTRDDDILFKQVLAVQGKTHRIESSCQEDKITFTLVIEYADLLARL